MDLKIVHKMLQDEGIQTVLDKDAIKEFVFSNENYHEVERVADGWKFNYINRECKTHVTYECKYKFELEEDVSLVFLICELEKYFGKQFYQSFYKNKTREILEAETNEYGLKQAMDANAIPFRYISLMGYEPYMTHSALLYNNGDEWAISYINRSGRRCKSEKTYGDYIDGMVGILECAFKLYLYDLFIEKQRNRGIAIRGLTDIEVSFLTGISKELK